MEIEVKTDVKVSKETEINFEAGVEADCYFKITLDPRKKDNIEVKFSGLIVTVKFKLSIKRGKGNGKKPKVIDPVKLIPSITHTQSIKFD